MGLKTKGLKTYESKKEMGSKHMSLKGLIQNHEHTHGTKNFIQKIRREENFLSKGAGWKLFLKCRQPFSTKGCSLR